jgi:hypothetical protein
MEYDEMAAAEASGVVAGIGLKAAGLAGLIAGAVSLLAVVLGFTVVPLTPGKEHIDAMRRLAAGLLSSFTVGPVLAFKAIEMFPWVMAPWNVILADEHILWRYLAAAAPFIALTAVLGFWLVAALMAWFTKRAGKTSPSSSRTRGRTCSRDLHHPPLAAPQVRGEQGVGAAHGDSAGIRMVTGARHPHAALRQQRRGRLRGAAVARQ